MYSLDVNFLRERRESQHTPKETESQDERATTQTVEGNLPLIIGGVVAVALPAVAGGVWYFTTLQIAEVEGEIAELQAELQQLQSQQQLVNQKQQELEQAEANRTALANIFNKIKPLSAILEDVRDRAPDNVQISSLQQSETEEGINFNVEGVGQSYEAVNYFFLTLQRSPFVVPNSVNLQTASKGSASIEIIDEPNLPNVEFSPKPVITYTISFQLNDQSASELLPILQEKGALGLVTRINTLEEKGIVQ